MEIPEFGTLEQYFVYFDYVRGDAKIMAKVVQQRPDLIWAGDYVVASTLEISNTDSVSLELMNDDPDLDSISTLTYDAALQMISQDIRKLLFIPPTAPYYGQLIIEAIKLSPDTIKYINNNFTDEKTLHEVRLLAVSLYNDIASKILNRYNQRDLYLAAARGIGWVHVAHSGDKEIILAALSSKYSHTVFVNPQLHTDKEVVKAMFISDYQMKLVNADDMPSLLAMLTRPDKLEILNRRGLRLEYFEDLHDSDQAVMIAVNNDGKAITYASDRLKSDPRIIKIAISNNPASFSAIAEFADSSILNLAMLRDGMNLAYVPSDKKTKDLVLLAVESAGLALQYADKYGTSYDIIKSAVACNGLALQYAPMNARCDPDIVLSAVAQNPEALKYAGYVCRNNLAILRVVAGREPKALLYSDTYNTNLYSILAIKKKYPDYDVQPITLPPYMFDVLLCLFPSI